MSGSDLSSDGLLGGGLSGDGWGDGGCGAASAGMYGRGCCELRNSLRTGSRDLVGSLSLFLFPPQNHPILTTVHTWSVIDGRLPLIILSLASSSEVHAKHFLLRPISPLIFSAHPTLG